MFYMLLYPAVTTRQRQQVPNMGKNHKINWYKICHLGRIIRAHITNIFIEIPIKI
jgi:hypothetical protein